ncbi:DUF1284 domain-containing protein [Pararhizobium sp. YC-54]|uniref:DUF1284 domain-containing protein n=1 Tax=Pararhizobium sp. YC-54 TaxID=2986920 RepID=UPI0021F72722|nr:DUF1284 domain-containing protein [Pararhizobium sp. YC-54]MCW0000371.1 DUF1284 domain-containing protein [Pararhizobium sp. YC-54]
MTIRLRPHHLLCMLTFVGRGYTQAFTENYIRIAARLSAGEDILVVEGPDDVCAPMLGEADHHCLCDSVTERDLKAWQAVEALLKVPAGPGASIRPDTDFLKRMREAFSAGSIREGCARCEWSPLCTGIAASGFDGVLVVPLDG